MRGFASGADGRIRRAGIGARADLTYDVKWLGDSLGPSRPSNSWTLKAAKKPMMIIGQGALARPDGAQYWRRAGSWRPRPGC